MVESEHDYLQLVLTAQVYAVATETPLSVATNLSARTRNTILVKREDLQPVFSFKVRGAHNRMAQLTASERLRGVVACSAGNHAQGVALAAQRMGVAATIVMPTATPSLKWRNVQRMGATVLLHGNDFDEAKLECNRISTTTGCTNISPFDDPYVIAGQGTIAVEILRQIHHENIDAIFVCVGGGGLIAGIASYIKRVCPRIKIVGVETYDACAMTSSLLHGSRVTLKEVGSFADGAAVKVVGKECFDLAKSLVDEMVLVSTDELCAAIKDTFEDTRTILEPAGALGIAGVKKYIYETGCIGKTFVAIASGANMNFDRLRFVAERAGLGENKEALISVVIPETPSSFVKLYSVIHPRSVTEFSYRYGNESLAHIFMSFEMNNRESEIDSLFTKLRENGMEPTDSSHNEMAKSHARYLIGGRSHLQHEQLFRFSFPERPGSLSHFLNTLNNPKWNSKSSINAVSLFHYRNYGGDVAKVMVGIQVPPETQVDFSGFLDALGYKYVVETNNPIYQNFLK